MEGITKSKSLLNPLDRAGEILFGLIMALTFTCSISIATRDTEVRQLLIGALGCNLAWGIVDATMYLIGTLAKRNKNKVIFEFVRDSSQADKAREYISDQLPYVVASILKTEEVEAIRRRLISLPDEIKNVKLTWQDIQKATGLFFLVFVSTFPVVVPFLFLQDTWIALRISNAIAIIMMFLCGWSVAKYVGINKWVMGVVMIIVGIILVAVTIALGG